MPGQYYRVAIRMNNVKHAFPGELSFLNQRSFKEDAVRDNQGGNTSASLVVWDESGRNVVFHMLVDAGMGTIRSLAQASDFGSPKRVDLILVTHGHIDHHCELVYACEMPVRLWKRRDKFPEFQTQPVPVPVYAPGMPSGCARRLAEIYGYSIGYHEEGLDAREKVHVAGEAAKKNGWIHAVHSLCPTNGPIRSLRVEEGPDESHQLKITPVGGVKHANALIYVVEIGGGDDKKKIVFAWDMECLPWNDLSASDVPVVDTLLHDADLMFVEMNTLLPRTTGHISFDRVSEFVNRTKPRECYVVHYSGFEDEFPGEKDQPVLVQEPIMCLDQLDDWLKARCNREQVPIVRAARAGTWYPSRAGWKWEL